MFGRPSISRKQTRFGVALPPLLIALGIGLVATKVLAADACKLCREDYQACVKAHSQSACKSNYDICLKHCRKP